MPVFNLRCKELPGLLTVCLPPLWAVDTRQSDFDCFIIRSDHGKRVAIRYIDHPTGEGDRGMS